MLLRVIGDDLLSPENWARLGLLGVTTVATIIYANGKRRGATLLTRLILALIAVYALAHIIFMIFLWQNHLYFPLNLEAMELTVLAHLRRVMSGLPLYVEPSSEFAALAYNPLYYFLCVPFAWVFGANLFTLRLVAILGAFGAGSIIFLAVRRATGSNWWSLMAVGLYAAAYRVMAAYLDNAHSDSWLLFTILLGCYLIDLDRSWITDLLGVLLTVTAFWFKQNGALFAIGAVGYLTWRKGWRKSLPFWFLAAILGPSLYFAAPPWIFGPRFHYFTWQVPQRWTELNVGTIRRLVGFTAKSYFALAISGCVASTLALLQQRRQTSIWYSMLPVAALSGFVGALDPWNNNNVFIPMGVWFIITGVLGLKELADHVEASETWGLHVFVFGASFALFWYNPSSVIVSRQATTAYQDMQAYLESLDGPVYAPWLGQLQDGYQFYPAVHWVPLEDMIRGPGIDEQNHPLTRKMLEPVLNPTSKAYILMTYPLENDSLLAFLVEDYVLDTDLGERFASLSTLPRRFNLLWPRYLYRFSLH